VKRLDQANNSGKPESKRLTVLLLNQNKTKVWISKFIRFCSGALLWGILSEAEGPKHC
jgi:hypothetical protein